MKYNKGFEKPSCTWTIYALSVEAFLCGGLVSIRSLKNDMVLSLHRYKEI